MWGQNGSVVVVTRVFTNVVRLVGCQKANRNEEKDYSFVEKSTEHKKPSSGSLETFVASSREFPEVGCMIMCRLVDHSTFISCGNLYI